MSVHRGTRVATLALAAVCASGCAIRMTHRCGVPQPVVEAAPGAGKLPLTVAVRYLPPPGASEVLMQRDPHHLWTVDPAPPTRALFERLASSVFERRVEAPAGEPVAPVDAVLEVRVERLRFAWVPVGMGPYTAAITYRAILRGADGAEITALELEGAGARGAVYELATHCKGIGDAVALAMQDAGGKLVTGLGANPAVVAWLDGKGIARPALAVRAADSYPPPVAVAPPADEYRPYQLEPSTVTPPDAPLATAGPPRPVAFPAPSSPVPRSAQIRVGLGVFRADASAGKLDDPRTGVSVTMLGAEFRPLRALGLTLDLATLGRGFSGRTLPSPGGFAVPRGVFLSSTAVGLGVRGIFPGGPLEPWVGVTGQLVRTELSSSYSLFGLTGSGDPSGTAWSAGVDVGTGLLLYVGRGVQLGIEVRRLFSRASFDPFPGSVPVGGVSTSLTFGAVLQ